VNNALILNVNVDIIVTALGHKMNVVGAVRNSKQRNNNEQTTSKTLPARVGWVLNSD
jgi:hypothetical protein